MEVKILSEQIKTIENLCAIARLLLEHDRKELLPTVLELLHCESQQIVDDYCIVDTQV